MTLNQKIDDLTAKYQDLSDRLDAVSDRLDAKKPGSELGKLSMKNGPSDAQRAASAANGKRGGRPKKDSK